MSIFSSWNLALVGKPWIRLDDAGTILAGGSPRSGAPRSIHFQADEDHWLSLVTDAIARGVISTTEHDGMRYVRQADLRRWCEASGTPWKVPHHPGEDDASLDRADHRPADQFLTRRTARRSPIRWIPANRSRYWFSLPPLLAPGSSMLPRSSAQPTSLV